MKNTEVVHLLKHYRHDIMNHLQVIKGYASMNKIDKVNNKLNQLVSLLNEESKLMNLNAPNLYLWIMQFNTIHANMRLSYTVNIDRGNLADIENQLLSRVQEVIDLIKKFGQDAELYDLEFIFSNTHKDIVLFILIDGFIKEKRELIMELIKTGNYTDVKEEDNTLVLQTHFRI